MKMNQNNPPKEKIPLFVVYKDDGILKARPTDDSYTFELYGFLNCLVQSWEVDLISDMLRGDKNSDS